MHKCRLTVFALGQSERQKRHSPNIHTFTRAVWFKLESLAKHYFCCGHLSVGGPKLGIFSWFDFIFILYTDDLCFKHLFSANRSISFHFIHPFIAMHCVFVSLSFSCAFVFISFFAFSVRLVTLFVLIESWCLRHAIEAITCVRFHLYIRIICVRADKCLCVCYRFPTLEILNEVLCNCKKWSDKRKRIKYARAYGSHIRSYTLQATKTFYLKQFTWNVRFELAWVSTRLYIPKARAQKPTNIFIFLHS